MYLPLLIMSFTTRTTLHDFCLLFQPLLKFFCFSKCGICPCLEGMSYQQKRWITVECLEKFIPGKKAREESAWGKRHWEELVGVFHGSVGNTFRVEIKFGDKSVRRGLLHLSITRLHKKCPPLLFKREIQRWDLSNSTIEESSARRLLQGYLLRFRL